MASHEGHLEALRKAGLPVDVLNERMVSQLAKLDEEDVQAIVSIRRKLNAGLEARLREAADTVGGFVW